ncbi:glycoside hydrolase superfamily [Radiomyces spectabilis]|uniref:glycoside hydrolase superfamily n=1 Tax=Radiomyces spectabilis TaxID=64574 RepID=UPI0022202A3B|nr:glycoside hydrolase superfamily [Radiomyces spectabilis]KAI8394083.1 glycoside hydrolase superfamily [Radiomyces spectabilis]
MRFRILQTLSISAFAIIGVHGIDNTCNDNLALYWGQNSYGAANAGDPSGWQKTLRYYCEDDIIDVIPVAFLTTFFSRGGQPDINLANICNPTDNSTFAGTGLANCSSLASDIKYCQSKGKAITLSLGGATGGIGFSSDAQATQFADTLWNEFLGGSSDIRPFGDAIFDGIDLDIEGGGAAHYDAFLHKLQGYFKQSDKRYYLTAAPQCVYPDANLQATINAVAFDAIYVQFYNNPCGLQTYDTTNWNFGVWDYWARHIAPNKDVKIYVGAPASASAAGGGYVPLQKLSEIATAMQKNFPSFGGVMFWDASQAYANGRIDRGIKQAMQAGQRCGNQPFQYPACSVPTFQSGKGYSGGDRVAFEGYIWQAKWSAYNTPSGDPNSEWSPVSACNGQGTSSGSPTASSQPPQATNSPPANDATTCTGVPEWSSSQVYVGGKKVTYHGSLYSAKWWTLNEVPTQKEGPWQKVGPCDGVSGQEDSSSPSDQPVAKLQTISVNRIMVKEDKVCSNATLWQVGKSYAAGSKAIVKNRVYTASWWNINQAPTNNKNVWKHDKTCSEQVTRNQLGEALLHHYGCLHPWSADAIYHEHSFAAHDGQLYQALKASIAQVPDADSNVWKKVTTCANTSNHSALAAHLLN